jgi:Spy/CpxP family protein refolding chaperone
MNHRKSFVLVLATALLCSASFAFAQHQHPDPATMVQKHVQRLTTLLSLTPAQQTQATTIFTNEMSTATNFHSSMKTAHQSLQTAIKANDQNAITEAANNIGSLTTQMVSTHAKAQAAFLQTLTPDQQSKMSQLESEGEMGFGPHRFFGR